jgi:plastocyanin
MKTSIPARHVLQLAVAVLFLGACGSDDPAGPNGGNNGGATNTIEMRDFSFSPVNLTVTAGTNVTWRNTGAVPHNTRSEQAGLWASADLQPNQTFARTFANVGTFPYECTLHPGMEGTVTVQ